MNTLPGPRLSIVVIAYNMARELPRTLQTLSANYQRGIDPHDYEVLILDNGITLPLFSMFLSNEDWKKGETKQDCYADICFIPMIQNNLPYPSKHNSFSNIYLKKSG